MGRKLKDFLPGELYITEDGSICKVLEQHEETTVITGVDEDGYETIWSVEAHIDNEVEREPWFLL